MIADSVLYAWDIQIALIRSGGLALHVVARYLQLEGLNRLEELNSCRREELELQHSSVSTHLLISWILAASVYIDLSLEYNKAVQCTHTKLRKLAS